MVSGTYHTRQVIVAYDVVAQLTWNQEALKRSGYDYRLSFNPQPPKPKHPRSRKIIWFNPPYSANVTTNIGHRFLRMMDECFPQSHPLRKIFNKNTLKLSYSCMPNVQNIISEHNKSLLIKENQNNPATTQECNCRRKETCPLSGKCQSEGIVYQATVTREDNREEKNLRRNHWGHIQNKIP